MSAPLRTPDFALHRGMNSITTWSSCLDAFIMGANIKDSVGEMLRFH